MSVIEDSLRAARAAIAGPHLELPPARLGAIVLRDDQRRIVARAEQLIARDGGCLVAEDVGLGKTFIALALAAARASPVVVAPAALRSTWRGAMSRAGVDAAFVSHEALSRGAPAPAGTGFVVVDESHHFRNPSTRRFDSLVQWLARTPVVLLSATPLQNVERDLRAQLALFLGERAFRRAFGTLSAHVVRGGDSAIRLPAVSAPVWVECSVEDDEVLDALLSLPPPSRALDAGDAGVLRTMSLVRAWSSSRAALAGALRTRVRVTAALAQSVESGRLPSKRELLAWSGDDAVQLGFATMLVAASAD
ncbi:MAG: hypothetical protein H0W68_09875, partial [Gemmatimonadaceae bacterium]|nr:hypothetical protein [Gemmatimonadaceae bacterium]